LAVSVEASTSSSWNAIAAARKDAFNVDREARRSLALTSAHRLASGSSASAPADPTRLELAFWSLACSAQKLAIPIMPGMTEWWITPQRPALRRQGLIVMTREG